METDGRMKRPRVTRDPSGLSGDRNSSCNFRSLGAEVVDGECPVLEIDPKAADVARVREHSISSNLRVIVLLELALVHNPP